MRDAGGEIEIEGRGCDRDLDAEKNVDEDENGRIVNSIVLDRR